MKRVLPILCAVLLALKAVTPTPVVVRYDDAIKMVQSKPAVVDVTITKEAIEYAIDDGLPSIMASASVEPVVEFDQQIGYRLLTVNPGSIWEALNLRAGDIVLEVEGIPLSSEERTKSIVFFVITQRTFTYTVRHKTGRVFEEVLYQVVVQ